MTHLRPSFHRKRLTLHQLGGTVRYSRKAIYTAQIHSYSPARVLSTVPQQASERRNPGQMRFIHCADVHLDTPLQGLAQYTGAPVDEIRNATRRAFEKILNAAISEKVDFIIIAGDLYDTGLKSFESALFFNKEMARLKDAGID